MCLLDCPPAMPAAVVAVIDPTPDDEELRAAVRTVVAPVIRRAHQLHGAIPGVKTEAWWSTPWLARLAAVLVLGEAYLIADPERAVVERLKAMAVDLSAAADWSAASRRPSYAELQRLRFPLDGDV